MMGDKEELAAGCFVGVIVVGPGDRVVVGGAEATPLYNAGAIMGVLGDDGVMGEDGSI